MTRGEGAAVGMTGDAGAAFRMTELTYFSSLKRFVCHISREPSNQSGLGEESIGKKYRYSCAYYAGRILASRGEGRGLVRDDGGRRRYVQLQPEDGVVA